jgi:hypothetical protein
LDSGINENCWKSLKDAPTLLCRQAGRRRINQTMRRMRFRFSAHPSMALWPSGFYLQDEVGKFLEAHLAIVIVVSKGHNFFQFFISHYVICITKSGFQFFNTI